MKDESVDPKDASRPVRHARQPSMESVSGSTPVVPPYESRGRDRGSASSQRSASRANRISASELPVKFTTPMSSADVYDALEREQEAIVNRLQREISSLKSDSARSRSQSVSSTSSMSRQTSTRSIYSSDAEELGGKLTTPRRSRPSLGSMSDDANIVQSLRKENEALKKKLADLSIKLTEKDTEIEQLSKNLRGLH